MTLIIKKQFENECLNPEAPIEWWFLQGFFEGTGLSKRYFMVSFFRQTLNSGDREFGDGYTLLSSFLNQETGINRTISRLDPKIFNWGLEKMNLWNQKINPSALMTDLFSEIKFKGPLSPVEKSFSEVVVDKNTLNVSWDDFHLKQQNHQIEFILPKNILGETNRLQINPVTPVYKTMKYTDDENPSKAMTYHTYPSCDLSGYVGKNEVSGRAWFDHQWGGYGMFTSAKHNKKLRGWDWFGVNLEDNNNWIIWINKDLKSGDVLSARAVCMGEHGKSYQYNNISAEPLRFWESSRTHIRYPVEWYIHIPGEDISFTFKPFADDQEIQVFGVYRSVWEGCGLVTCQNKNQTLTGFARGEFFGYGFLSKFSSYYQYMEERIINHIHSFFPEKADRNHLTKLLGDPSPVYPAEACNETIFKPVWDLMNRKGKLWRPTFSLLMLRSLGCDVGDYESFLSVFPELSHTGSLIIDDIEDRSPLRRGEAAIHKKYGTDIAINAANSVYFLPFLNVITLWKLTPDQKNEIYRILIQAYISAHFGQAADIYWSRNLSQEYLKKWLKEDLEEQILDAYSAKTGAVIMGMSDVIGVIAEKDQETRHICIKFAKHFGIAFQIMDDIKNFDTTRSRKKAGEDISEGKLTYVVVRALKSLPNDHMRTLADILCDADKRGNAEYVEQAVSLIRKSGALEESHRKASGLFKKSWNDFSRVSEHNEPRLALKMMCLKLLDF